MRGILIFEENLVKCSADLALRRCKAGTLRVRRLAHEQHNALVAELAESCYIHHLAFDRGEIELEVARVDDNSRGRMDSERARIGYRVVYADEFDRENARLYGVARLNAVEHRRNIIVELAELALEHAEV